MFYLRLLTRDSVLELFVLALHFHDSVSEFCVCSRQISIPTEQFLQLLPHLENKGANQRLVRVVRTHSSCVRRQCSGGEKGGGQTAFVNSAGMHSHSTKSNRREDHPQNTP